MIAQCDRCRGSGTYSYPDSSMGMGGMAGQMFTTGPCPGTKRGYLDSDCPVVASRAFAVAVLLDSVGVVWPDGYWLSFLEVPDKPLGPAWRPWARREGER